MLIHIEFDKMKCLLLLILSVFGSFVGYRDISTLKVKIISSVILVHDAKTHNTDTRLHQIMPPELKPVKDWTCSFDDLFCMYKNVY